MTKLTWHEVLHIIMIWCACNPCTSKYLFLHSSHFALCSVQNWSLKTGFKPVLLTHSYMTCSNTEQLSCLKENVIIVTIRNFKFEQKIGYMMYHKDPIVIILIIVLSYVILNLMGIKQLFDHLKDEFISSKVTRKPIFSYKL